MNTLKGVQSQNKRRKISASSRAKSSQDEEALNNQWSNQ